MKKNKILFLTLNTFSSIGGIEDVCKTFCKVLSDSVKSYKVLSINDDRHDPKFIDGKNFKGYNKNKLKFGLQAIKLGLKYDIIILSHINLVLFAWIMKFLNPKLRIILYAHGIEVWRPLPIWKTKFLRKFVEFWSVSTFTAQELATRHGIDNKNIRILNNCLNPFFKLPLSFEKPAHLLRRYKIQSDQPILFTLTRISSSEKYKGYDIIIDLLPELIKIYPKLIYILSGKADSDERDRLVKQIKMLNLENHVFLSGFVDYEELSDHFLLSDGFILPSKKEGFGIVFIESAACGCRVIAGNKDGSRDAVLNGELGTLVNPDKREEILEAINKMLSKDKTIAEAKSIQTICLQHFSFERYKENVARLLKDN